MVFKNILILIFKNKNKFEFLSGPFKNLIFTTLEQNKLYLILFNR